MLAGVTIDRKAGHTLPAEFVSYLLAKDYNRYIGFAFADGEEVKVTRLVKSDRWSPSLETIKGADERMKDRRVVYHFGKCTDELLNNSDVQPYSLIHNDQNKTQLVAFLDGNFSQFTNTDSAKFEQSLCVEKYISPKVKQISKMVNHDLGKIEEFLEDETTAQDMINTMVSDRGNIVFLAADDWWVKYTVKGDTSFKEFDWGWVSNTEGYGAEEVDPLIAAAEAAKVTKKSGFRRTAGSTATSVPETKKDNKPLEIVTEVIKPDEEITLKIPEGIVKDIRKKSKWMRKRIPGGILPKNFMDATHITVLWSKAPNAAKDDAVKQGVVKSFEEMGDKLKATTATALPKSEDTGDKTTTKAVQETTVPTKKSSFRKSGSDTTKVVELPPKKDVEPHHVGKPDGGVIEGRLAIIPPAQIAEMKLYMESDHYKEALDRHNQRIKDPAKYQKMEDTIPSFVKQMAHPLITELSDTFVWPNEILFQMIKNVPDLAMTYMANIRLDDIKLRREVDELRSMVAKLQGNVEEREEEFVQPQPEKKKSSFRRAS